MIVLDFAGDATLLLPGDGGFSPFEGGAVVELLARGFLLVVSTGDADAGRFDPVAAAAAATASGWVCLPSGGVPLSPCNVMSASAAPSS
jgi:hypothetical protein